MCAFFSRTVEKLSHSIFCWLIWNWWTSDMLVVAVWTPCAPVSQQPLVRQTHGVLMVIYFDMMKTNELLHNFFHLFVQAWKEIKWNQLELKQFFSESLFPFFWFGLVNSEINYQSTKIPVSYLVIYSHTWMIEYCCAGTTRVYLVYLLFCVQIVPCAIQTKQNGIPFLDIKIASEIFEKSNGLKSW